MSNKLFIAIALSTAFPVEASAQDNAQVAAPAPAPGAATQLRGNWLQADRTRQQAQQMADMLFQRLDANHDGTVTRQEAEQASGAIGGRGERAQRMISRAFGNAQSVTLADFEARALARFDAQDLNHDGVVTADERQQARAARRQERGN
jgi:hypothetical protein